MSLLWRCKVVKVSNKLNFRYPNNMNIGMCQSKVLFLLLAAYTTPKWNTNTLKILWHFKEYFEVLEGSDEFWANFFLQQYRWLDAIRMFIWIFGLLSLTWDNLRWCRARDLFGLQIPVTTGGFELRISCIRSSYLTH